MNAARESSLFVATCLAVALVSSSPGCGPDCRTPTADSPPNVILITIDTLRADHLGCYGAASVRTPHLDRLAAEGTLFERCYAHTHLTVPSHMTILTSLLPAEHGALRNSGAGGRSLDPVTARFAQADYRTAAFVSAKHVGHAGPLGRVLTGLEVFKAPGRMSKPYRAEETNRRALRWIGKVCQDPFFAWVHYWDPHMPYDPPHQFERMYYEGDPYDAGHTSMQGVELSWNFYDHDSLKRELLRRTREVRFFKQKLGVTSQGVLDLLLNPPGLRGSGLPPEAEETLKSRLADLARSLKRTVALRSNLADWLSGVRDIDYATARYAAEVSYVDAEIGQLRAQLDRLGLTEQTVIVVTADHGEAHGEHGVFFDHAGLHEETLRVPLIAWAPGRIGPGRRTEVVRHIDVAPTLLASAGLSVPPAMRGRNLLDDGGSDEPVIAEAKDLRQSMIRQGKWKLIRTDRSFYYTDAFAPERGTAQLYDLETDPLEQTNLVRVHPSLSSRLGSDLERSAAEYSAASTVEDAQTSPGSRKRSSTLAEQLRALGYVE